MKNFKELKVWKKGFQIATDCYKLTNTFPKEEKFGIQFQINKSAISIPSNIAEGSSRSSEKEYKRFMEISLGSCFELETQLLISGESGYGNDELRNKILREIDEEQKMLIAFIKRLN